jgi:hypothetical protein
VAELAKFDEELMKKIQTGASIRATGKLVASQGTGQAVEMVAEGIVLLGEADAETYPLQKKKHTLEFLREIVKIILEEQLSTHYKVMLLKHEDKIKAERNNSKQKDTTTSRSVSSIIPSLTKEVISKIKITIPSLEINQLKMLAFFKAINEVKKETTKMEIEMKKLILN